MSRPVSTYLTLLDHEIHVTQWGAAGAEPVVMWHGLARTGRDFDDLAEALSGRYRIYCPDTLGRGMSQWAADPDSQYSLAHYAALASALVDELGLARFHWVGTSMGGAIGMAVAGGALKTRIGRLVLNDIGPALNPPAVERIKAYAGNPPAFASMTEFERFLRTIYAPYGALSDAQWRRMAETSVRRTEDGRLTVHYDPRMVRQFVLHPRDYELWPAYDQIACPTLVLRGESSDLLTEAVAREMTRRGPRCRLETIAGCGHAPALNVSGQISLVADFLAGG
ncbi:MAG: alpha/beta hydrolase [Alphaproteobacteria bacterium]|nr:alpha/beta hydrolase [Alphaproteobacteria bacterium]